VFKYKLITGKVSEVWEKEFAALDHEIGSRKYIADYIFFEFGGYFLPFPRLYSEGLKNRVPCFSDVTFGREGKTMRDIRNADGHLVAMLDELNDVIIIWLKGFETRIIRNPDGTYDIVNNKPAV